MGKVAFLFAGQGAQHPQMGIDLIEASAAAREVFEVAEALRPGTIEQLRSSSKEELSRTENTQPCVFAHDLAAAMALSECGVVPSAVAGFSLGEVAALTFAGVFSTAKGFELVCRRAEFMAEASLEHAGEMRAVIKLEASEVERLAHEAGAECWPVNYNSPQQTVVAGSCEACATLDRLVREAGGRTMKVVVSGAFHSPYMQSASEGLTAYLNDGYMPQQALIPVISNMTAQAYPTDPAQAAELLAEQVCHPVQWVRTLEHLSGEGFDTFVEVGPGKTLTGLVRRTLKDAATYTCETAEDVESVAAALGEA